MNHPRKQEILSPFCCDVGEPKNTFFGIIAQQKTSCCLRECPRFISPTNKKIHVSISINISKCQCIFTAHHGLGQDVWDQSKVAISIIGIDPVAVFRGVFIVFIAPGNYVKVWMTVFVEVCKNRLYIFMILLFFPWLNSCTNKPASINLDKQDCRLADSTADKNIIQSISIDILRCQCWSHFRELIRQEYLSLEVNKLILLMNKIQHADVCDIFKKSSSICGSGIYTGRFFLRNENTGIQCRTVHKGRSAVCPHYFNGVNDCSRIEAKMHKT